MPINRFRGQFFFLSNFYPCENGVEYDGDVYPTSEHAYQAAKAERSEARQGFTIGGSLGPNPMVAKMKGKSIKKRQNWFSMKVDVMLTVVRSKFQRDTKLQDKLLATQNQTIIEGHTNDVFWGGKRNHLGNILMRLRDEYRQQRQQAAPLCAPLDSDEHRKERARRKGDHAKRDKFQEQVELWCNADLIEEQSSDEASSDLGFPGAGDALDACELETQPKCHHDHQISLLLRLLKDALQEEVNELVASMLLDGAHVLLKHEQDVADFEVNLNSAVEILQNDAPECARLLPLWWRILQADMITESSPVEALQAEDAHEAERESPAMALDAQADFQQGHPETFVGNSSEPALLQVTLGTVGSQEDCLARRRPRGGQSRFRRKYAADHASSK